MNKRYEIEDKLLDILTALVKGEINIPEAKRQIFAITGIAIVDREAELPNPEPSSLDPQYGGETLHYGRVCGEVGYRRAQQDMVKKGWVEEVKDVAMGTRYR